MRKTTILSLLAVMATAAAQPSVAQEQASTSQALQWPKISGFVNGRYAWDSGDNDTHGFDIRRVRLAATGDVTRHLDYKVQAEYETTVKVIDAYVRWKITKPFNVQIGEFKVPYSQETLYGPTTWLTIENPAAVSKLNGYDDLSGLKVNGRDIGLAFYGDLLPDRSGSFSYITYRIGLFNGNGINTKDDNNRKDFAGLLEVHPVKELTLSAGHYQGSYGKLHEEHVRIRTSAGLEWKDRRLTLRSEYLHGNTAGKKSDGVYALAAWQLSRWFQPIISYDYFQADKTSGEHQGNYQVGLNVTPVKPLRIQAAYTYQDNHIAEDVHRVEIQGFVQF